MGEIADEHQSQLMLDQTPSTRDNLRWQSRCPRCKQQVVVIMTEGGDMTRWDNSRQKHICPTTQRVEDPPF